MTTIHAHSAAASARYYTRYLTGDGPDAEGHWLGRRAGAVGLGGKRVETDELEALLSGHHPVTGGQLGYPLRDRVDSKRKLIPAVAGFDATFSAPKSLSVWWGLTGDAGLLKAHDLAVRAVLDHLEKKGATTRIRVDDRRQYPDVDGLIMAAFPQATSREDDPQLHTHVVISAKVLAPDGRWLALDARYLKRKQRALGGLYQSVLRAELTSRYGVAWGPIEKGQAEIAGMPKELLDTFSKRTAQVDAALAEKVAEFREREGRDPTRWERAALTREASEDTRAKKTHATPDDLGSHWRDQAKALGWTPTRLLERMQDAARTHPTPDQPTAIDVIEQLSAAGSAWHRADVLQAICDLTPPVAGVPGQRWAAAVERACDRMIETCTSLDPPSERAQASVGRPVHLDRPHRTKPDHRGRTRPGGTDPPVRHRRPRPARSSVAHAGPERAGRPAGRSGSRRRWPRPARPRRRAGRHRQDHHSPPSRRRPRHPTAPCLRRRAHRQGGQNPAGRDRHAVRHGRQADPRVAQRAAPRRVPAPAGRHAHRRRGRDARDREPRRPHPARRVPAVAARPRRGPPPAPSRRTRRHVRRAVPHRARPRAGHDSPLPPPVGASSVAPAARQQPRSARRLLPPRPRWHRRVRHAHRRCRQPVDRPPRRGQLTLPADYAHEHVRLGYAATAHGHQGDTVDISLTVVTAAMTHRSLYVGATRGRDLNRLLVVTDEPDLASDVLEEVLTNDRADLPAVAQRRHLALHVPSSQGERTRTQTAEDVAAAARYELSAVRQQAEPFLRPLHDAEQDVAEAERTRQVARRAHDTAPIWRRRGLAKMAASAAGTLDAARERLEEAQELAAPHLATIAAAEARVHEADRAASTARLRDRLDHLAERPQVRALDRGLGIER